MEAQLFSESLDTFEGEIINTMLQETLKNLSEFLGNEVQVLSWSGTQIGVPLTVSVELPTLGTHENIDIREYEPIVLVFDIKEYPYKAPLVYTNRLDFPKDKLAHLYIAMNDRPPAFCYVRGNRDDWYNNKRIQDLVIRISNWLSDAASGMLVQDGNQFDPLRLEGYVRTIIYDYDKIAKVVDEKQSFRLDDNFAIGLFELIPGGFKLIKIGTPENIGEIATEMSTDDDKDVTVSTKKYYRIGYIVWATTDDVFNSYNIKMPENWGEFKMFCSEFDIPCEKFESFYIAVDPARYVVFPVIIAIRRPKQLIGFSSNYEFLNFRFSVHPSTEVVDNKIIDTACLELSSHNQPLSVTKAIEISGLPVEYKLSATIFGCGALGSKIIMHLSREGVTNLTVVDHDNLSPHNMVRHALLPEYIGQNKARALKNVISDLYPTDESKVAAIDNPELLFDLEGILFKFRDWVFDFTASESFFSKIALTKYLNDAKVACAHISDFGNIGIFLCEGNNRNPRIDDLKIALFGHYKDTTEIMNWLRREYESQTKTNITVAVGVGCNSETTILPDDKISLHAAFITRAILKENNQLDKKEGKIRLSIIQDDEELSVKTLAFSVLPLDIFEAINNPLWSIRFKNGIIEQITKETKKAGRNETGGVFIGVANHKTKTIHVTDLIPAPPDSRANQVCFFRGHMGLPETIGAIYKASGGQLGYVGEWHSHPLGPNCPSETDMKSVANFKSEFDKLATPLPVFLTIVTNKSVLPYVF